ncbi:MAG: hypothetical protein J5486_10980 [Bacteroidaceae bacterium]|nr:hypothetical protein [Bacteroidaceae bacterium]
MKALFTYKLVFAIVISYNIATAMAQDAYIHPSNSVSIRISQLYYEAGWNITLPKSRHSSEMLRFAIAYGKPTRHNAWRKFMPEIIGIPSATAPSTEHLYAGLIAAGWTHWFSNVLGLYGQIGWGFIADLSQDNLASDLTNSELPTDEKTTFIYNTMPMETGLSIKPWKHWLAEIGVTYMWKEIPLLTIGLGYAF